MQQQYSQTKSEQSHKQHFTNLAVINDWLGVLHIYLHNYLIT